MFVDRGRRDDRFLEWKVRLFSVAAVLALAGLYLEERWMTGTAIAVLAIAMLLRFLPGGRLAEGPEEDAGDWDGDEVWGEEPGDLARDDDAV